MTIFLAKTLKIRGGWGSVLTPPVEAPPLPNPGCATGKPYEVLPFPKFWTGYATETGALATPVQMENLWLIERPRAILLCCIILKMLPASSLDAGTPVPTQTWPLRAMVTSAGNWTDTS